MKRFMRTALLACLALVVSVATFADGYTNPVIKTDFPDPSVIKAEDGYYYMYSTQTGQGRIPIYRSTNLVNWEYVGAAFNEETRPIFPGDVDELWAPDINYINGQYVLYYSVSEMNEGKKNGIGVAVSDSPAGPFTVANGGNPLFTSESIGVNNSIDPFFIEDNGKNYLFWGSFNGIYWVELSADGLSVVSSKATQIINKKVEASSIYKHDGYYYFIGSQGGFEIDSNGNSTYKLVVARATSLTGAYYNKANQAVKSTILNTNLTTILESTAGKVIGPGHCTEIVEDEEGGTWLLHHGYTPDLLGSGGRQTYLQKVEWGSDGWPYIDSEKLLGRNEMPGVTVRIGQAISTPQDLIDYANYVNAGHGEACAYLTNDIDMDGITNFPGIGRDFKEGRMHGTLDGQGFRIKNLHMDGDCVALVTVAADNCVIKNLILDSSCSFTGTGRNAAFVSACNWPEWGTNVLRIENCGNEANVTGTGANCAAFVGCNYHGGLKIEIANCYNTGHVKGGNESAIFSGWFGNGGSTVDNCWNIAEVEGAEGSNVMGRGIGTGNYRNTYNLSGQDSHIGGIDGYTSDWMTTGQLAYFMNGEQTSINWYQALDGSDAQPYPFKSHGQVYLNGELRCDGTSAGGDLVYSNSSTSVIPPHTLQDGFCTVCGSFIETGLVPVGGYYEIANARQLYWYAKYVNAGHGEANARLMNDIDMNGITDFPGIGRDFKEGRLHGTLDGQGFRIKNLHMDGENVALVTLAADNCVIKNLILDSSCSFTGTGRNAAFVSACNYPEWGSNVLRIENCGNEANVVGTGANCAAFLGCNYSGGLKIEIANCYNTGHVKGGWESAIFSGWFSNGGSSVDNCWNIAEVEGVDGRNVLGRGLGEGNYHNTYNLTEQGSSIPGIDGYTSDWLTTGQLAYYMNGDQTSIHWYQAMDGSDAQPYPFMSHGQVYLNGELKCDGSSAGGDLVYSNSSTSVIPPHTFEDGLCTVCGYFDKDGKQPVDGYFEIATARDLYWFSKYVDQVDASVNAKLLADIDYSAYETGYIGRAENNAYAGTFDGQQHKITLGLKSTIGQTGLFAYAHGANIKNLIVDGTVTMENHNCGGGLGGRVEGTTVDNVVVYTTIIDAQSGDGTIGGIFAVTAADWKITSLNNVAFYGRIQAPNRDGNGALVGWADNGSNTHFNNCIVAPAEISWRDGATFSRKNNSVSNCLVLEGAVPDNNHPVSGTIILTSSDDLASGQAAIDINEILPETKWFQNLESDVDALPVPFDNHGTVYANGSLNCDGSAKEGTTISYSNHEGQNRDPHIFVAEGNGLCTVCHAGEEPNAVDDVYQLGNIGNLLWFANHVSIGNTTANAVLTADIVQPEDVEYLPIGTPGNNYKGSFDGQRHSVTLHINRPEQNYQGMFGVITDGVHITNLVVKGEIVGRDFVGGIAGGTNGGASNTAWTKLEHCGNEANVTATGVNAGGMIGVNIGGSCSFEFNNCYNTGTIQGGESGAFSGWSGGGWSIMRNCWNSGATDGYDLTRNNGTTLLNCYAVEGSINANDSRIILVSQEALNNEVPALINRDAVVDHQGTWVCTGNHPLPVLHRIDVNEDGHLSSADVAALVDAVKAAAGGIDINLDGTVNEADVEELVNFYLLMISK